VGQAAFELSRARPARRVPQDVYECLWTQVALPVGQEIKYKYVVRSGKDWRWELGFDRSLLTQPNVRQLVEIRDVIRSNGSLPPTSLYPSLPPSPNGGRRAEAAWWACIVTSPLLDQ
jgi:hypothetical protein